MGTLFSSSVRSIMKKIRKNKAFLHRIHYINWYKESETKTVSIDEGKAKLEFLKTHGSLAKSMTKREDWLEEHTYMLVRKGYWRSLTFFENDTYNHWVWHSGDDSKNTGVFTNEGAKSATLVNEHLQNRVGKTLKGAFGYTEDDTLRQCVPKQFYYIKDVLKDCELENISKSDMSSHYPASFCGQLPDIRTAIKLEGEHNPTEEYPFAFYVGTGHCAEYNRFDTREWVKHEIAQSLVNDTKLRTIGKCPFKISFPHYGEHCEYTLLCKASEYTLTEEMSHFYQQKKNGDPDAKLVMNSFIGYCHPKENRPSYRLYHLAAICIGRANQKMIEVAEEIGVENVVQLIVDGIIYIDENNPVKTYSTSEKELGRLIKENDKEKFKMIGCNQYMFVNPVTQEPTCITASGFNSGVVETKTFDDMKNWRRV